MNDNTLATASGVSAGSGLAARAGMAEAVKVGEHFVVECFDQDGNLKWRDEFDNLVVATGLNELISQTFKASSYTAAWYVGLTDSTPTVAAGDTMASHAGWVEVTDYSEGTRPALTLGTVSGGSANNSASKATFSINGTATIGGCFVANNSTKGGTSGVLFGAGAFAEGDRSVVNGDSLAVSVTISMTAS